MASGPRGGPPESWRRGRASDEAVSPGRALRREPSGAGAGEGEASSSPSCSDGNAGTRSGRPVPRGRSLERSLPRGHR
ncbi:hypothetical protein NDU88_001598 [Pleurodeles waltl]|uniref:Uncharacterized protein n=1 Tax=Pleurodeles waltl TaxID=8319 RepID=A0AAV7L9Y4_PLEWA|nr:hypothetical protein NDU88_001598 [Pleurodeles waltl]